MPRRHVVYPREVLNELRWWSDRGLERAEIHYKHRGAPADTRIISGIEIVELGRSFFRATNSEIPYHRITKIIHDGNVLYDSKYPCGKKTSE